MATDKLVDFDHVTDYISRDAAYKTLTEYYHHSSGVQHTALREALNRVPTADAVEVVRCRDCKHRPVVTDESHPYGFGLACPKEGAYQDVTCPYLCDYGYYNRMPADGWYCAEGERRADNGK